MKLSRLDVPHYISFSLTSPRLSQQDREYLQGKIIDLSLVAAGMVPPRQNGWYGCRERKISWIRYAGVDYREDYKFFLYNLDLARHIPFSSREFNAIRECLSQRLPLHPLLKKRYLTHLDWAGFRKWNREQRKSLYSLVKDIKSNYCSP